MIFFRRFRIALIKAKLAKLQTRKGKLMAEQTIALEWDAILGLSAEIAALNYRLRGLCK